MHRRDFILATVASMTFPAALRAHPTDDSTVHRSPPQLDEIERRVGGRLGVVVIDVRREARLTHRADERFPMCSTFKWLLAAQVLSRVERREETLERFVPYTARDLLEYAPVTRERISDGGMTVYNLCAAAIQYSDNTAANLLLSTIGGPSGFTSYVRGIGDSITRLDRLEPELNSATPRDPRDTTTPSAMADDLRRVLLGDILSEASRNQLLTWLAGNKTGAAKLRAGIPDSWRIGDKTGMGAHGATNDVAIMWPAREAPLLVAAYLTESDAPVDERNGALADVARFVTEWALQ